MKTKTKTSRVSGKGTANRVTDWTLIERLLASPLVRTMYLHGAPGLGKTWSAYRTGRIQAGMYAITLTEDTPAAELRGFYLNGPDGMQWHDGPFTTAMRAGARLVINELSHAAPDVLALLYPVLESMDTARLTLPTNETIRPAHGFHVICTDNQGIEDLPPALQDRFDAVVEVRDPHPDALEVFEAPIRRAAERSFALETERRVSLRGWGSVQRLAREFGLAEACNAVFGHDRGAQVDDAIVLADAGG